MYGEPKVIEVKKDENNREKCNIIILERITLSITDDDARSLMWKLADLLDYETRSKW